MTKRFLLFLETPMRQLNFFDISYSSNIRLCHIEKNWNCVPVALSMQGNEFNETIQNSFAYNSDMCILCFTLFSIFE